MTAGAKPDIDEAGARRFLAGWCGHGPGAVELVGEGEWSRCFAFTRDGRELVVRFGRHVDDFAKDRMAAAWSRSALPVPAVLDIGLAQDGWYAISERMHGEPLDQLDAAGWRAALPAVLNALDALRAIEPPATGFGPWPPPPVGASGSDPTSAGFESWREFLLSAAGDGDPRQRTPVWRDELADAGLATAYDRAAELLTDLADAGPGKRHVVHAFVLPQISPERRFGVRDERRCARSSLAGDGCQSSTQHGHRRRSRPVAARHTSGPLRRVSDLRSNTPHPSRRRRSSP
jgi:hypothetical protein